MRTVQDAGDTPQDHLRQACAELRRRLQAGEPCCAEQLLEEFPTLASHDYLTLELIFTEFAVRQDLGQTPAPAEWYARFPQWHEHLRQRFERQGVRDASSGLATVPERPHATPAQAAVPPLEGGEPFGRYLLLEELGRGGMGVVYRARDTLLGRVVALKVIRAGASDEQAVERFYREAQAVAQVRHPHLVQVLDLDRHDGRHYFTMPFAAGGSLAEQRADFADAARAVALLEKVARAMGAAHEQGVVHRDLKPGNILLDEQGEPVVSDFGLAKFLDGDGDLTCSGQMLGTPAYMAPEQAAGHANRVTAACDVWALGVILYELLVGERPFRGKARDELMARILRDEPRRPRTLHQHLDRALEAVVLKCLEKEPGRRYRTGRELADDLQRWQRGQPTVARPRIWRSRLGLALRRYRTVAGVLVLCLIGAVPLASRGLQPAPAPPLPQEKAVPDPDRPLREIEAELAAGRRVVLVGDTGGPRWSRWCVPEDPGLTPPPRGDTFTIQAWGHALLELVPDPQLARYRFSARIKHLRSDSLGAVGLYVAHHAAAGPPESVHQFVWVWFNDIWSPEVDPSIRAQVNGGKPLVYAPVTLEPHYIRGRGGPRFGSELGVEGVRLRLCEPGGTDNTSWRQVVVEVTPDEVRAYWEKGRQEIGPLTFAKMTSKATPRLQGFSKEFPDHPFITRLGPHFAARGGLGLYLRNSSATFCSVNLEPLTEDPAHAP